MFNTLVGNNIHYESSNFYIYFCSILVVLVQAVIMVYSTFVCCKVHWQIGIVTILLFIVIMVLFYIF